jgi:hypothetical protein
LIGRPLAKHSEGSNKDRKSHTVKSHTIYVTQMAKIANSMANLLHALITGMMTRHFAICLHTKAPPPLPIITNSNIY